MINHQVTTNAAKSPFRVKAGIAALGMLTVVFSGRVAEAESPVHKAYGEARVGGHFTLTDTQSHGVQDTDFRGRLMLVYLGYSHCPDVCPMTLGVMGEALKLLGKDAESVAPLFISLDPQRDTPQALKTYLAQFDPRIIGLTGSKEAIEELTKHYAGYAQKVPLKTGDYLIDHSGFLYLMDKQGRYVRHFDANVKAPELAQAIREQR